MKIPAEGLMNLPAVEYSKLSVLTLPNNDIKTDDIAWEKRGIENVDSFVEKTANVLNLMLGKK